MYKSGNGFGDQRKVLSTPAGTPAVGYTAEELQRMKSALNRKLGPEFISKRKGPGFSSVQYLEGWKAINLANDIFGPNGWCTELKEFKVDYIDDRHGAISMGLSCIVRVILKDGTFHEDIGYGSIDNCKNKAAAFDKCKKEAFTDGMKRALRQFGNALGNCLYDKEFLQQITKVTSEPNDFDANALLRRSTTLPKVFAPNAMTRHEDYQEEGIKREDTLKPIRGQTITPNVASVPKKDVKNDKTVASTAGPAPVRQLSPRKSRDDGEDSFMFSDDWPEDDEVNNQILKSNNYEKEQLPESDFEFDEVHEGGEVSVASVADKTATGGEKMKPPMGPMNTSDEPTAVANTSRISTPIPDKVTFVSATSADTIQQDPTLQTSLKFDVRATGSQIAKSSFINHSKSLPVKRSLLQTSTVSANRNVQRGKPLQSHGTRPLGLGNNHNVNVSTNANNAITGNNPLAKRAFGLPPDRADGKRLRK